METAEKTNESTEDVGAVPMSPSISLLGWHEFATDPPVDHGHYLCIWDNVTHRDYPGLCSDYSVLLWCGGKWWAPVCEKQPVLYWRELPEKPNK